MGLKFATSSDFGVFLQYFKFSFNYMSTSKILVLKCCHGLSVKCF